MFDIGWTELLVIAVVAILVVGPKDLPRMLRSLGRYAGKLRRTANEFRQQFDDAIRESELDELRTSVESVRNIDPMKDIKDSMDEGMRPLQSTADDIRREAEKPVPQTATETPEPAAPAPTSPAEAARRDAEVAGRPTAPEPVTPTPAASKPAASKPAAPEPGARAAKGGA